MIENNPFYVLGATPIDNRQKIIKLAEEKSFQIDEDLCQKARSDLTVPRNRILAELNWFIGIPDEKLSIFLNIFKKNKNDPFEIKMLILKKIFQKDSPYFIGQVGILARINILIELLDTDNIKFGINELENIITDLAYAFENLDIYEIVDDINKDRVISGFNIINDYELVQDYLNQKKINCIKLIIKQLNTLYISDLIAIMSKIVDDETSNGKKQAPTLIEDLVDDYKLNVQNFLNIEFQKIKKFIEFIENETDYEIIYLIDNLFIITKKLIKVSYPIIISMNSRGLEYELSRNLGFMLRSLGIDLANNHNYFESSLEIMNFLNINFKDLPELIELIKKDIEILNKNKKSIGSSYYE